MICSQNIIDVSSCYVDNFDNIIEVIKYILIYSIYFGALIGIIILIINFRKD